MIDPKSGHSTESETRSYRYRFDLARTFAPITRRGAVTIETGVSTVDNNTAKQYLVQDDAFEWDDAKAASNWLDHGVRFEAARDVFKDIFAIEWADDHHGDTEERFLTVGMVEDRLLFVSYTLRGERIRIISAREAEPRERRRYHNENQT